MSSPERECQLCGRPAPLACSGCGAMFYCSEGHRRKHAAQLGHDAAECGRMAAAAAPERRQVRPCRGGLALTMRLSAQAHAGAATCKPYHISRAR